MSFLHLPWFVILLVSSTSSLSTTSQRIFCLSDRFVPLPSITPSASSFPSTKRRLASSFSISTFAQERTAKSISEPCMLHNCTIDNHPNNNDSRKIDKPSETTVKTTEKSQLVHLPRHVAFICDGNSRWARQKSLPQSMGHAAGADRVMNILTALQDESFLSGLDPTQWCPTQSQRFKSIGLRQSFPKSKMTHRQENSSESEISDANQIKKNTQRIQYCTLFAFSTENWSRPSSEISTLMKIMEQFALKYRKTAIEKGNVQIEILGDLDDKRIPEGTRSALRRLEHDTKLSCCKGRGVDNAELDRNEFHHGCENGDGIFTICLAINYGGRADVLSAACKLAQSITSGELTAEDAFDESEISKRLCTKNLPDPDLIVRTGGEKRLSNFLLWDAAYSELYFSDALWPDFDESALKEVLRWYGQRIRRFGGREKNE